MDCLKFTHFLRIAFYIADLLMIIYVQPFGKA